jgi:hypothetical protein
VVSSYKPRVTPTMSTSPFFAHEVLEGCKALNTALASQNASDETTCCLLLDTWLEHFDPNQELCRDRHCNDTHIFGIGLSTCMHRALQEELTHFDLKATLGQHAARVCIYTQPLHLLSFQQTLETLLSLQIEFNKLYSQETAGQGDKHKVSGPNKKERAKGAITCAVDIEIVLIMLLAHMGSFLGQRWRETGESLEILQGVLEREEDGWCRVSLQSAIGALDAMHAMLVASRLLAKAESIEQDDAPPPPLVYNFHREASLDDFYDISTAADCPVGAILQYKHRFRFLFHSVSQVVYFHYPSYQRRKQLPLVELQAHGAPHLNLLPLLAQVVVDMPILAEHSGLGLRTTHARHPWAWAVVAQRVLLIDSDLRVFCACDIRKLLLHANPEAGKDQDNLGSVGRKRPRNTEMCDAGC